MVPPQARNKERVASFQRETVAALAEVVAAAGLEHPRDLRPEHLRHRVSATDAEPASVVYRLLKPGELIDAPENTHMGRSWALAQAESFAPAG